jgi:hypothetical protein
VFYEIGRMFKNGAICFPLTCMSAPEDRENKKPDQDT